MASASQRFLCSRNRTRNRARSDSNSASLSNDGHRTVRSRFRASLCTSSHHPTICSNTSPVAGLCGLKIVAMDDGAVDSRIHKDVENKVLHLFLSSTITSTSQGTIQRTANRLKPASDPNLLSYYNTRLHIDTYTISTQSRHEDSNNTIPRT